ncbi:MAG: GH25 family lysozyme [Polyangiaceae bacterium]
MTRLRLLGLCALGLAACANAGDSTSSGRSSDVPADERIATAQDAATVCAPNDVVYGIDVSTYQGDVDWEAVAGAGYKFAIARINHGSTMDDQFDKNWPAIKAVGLIRGAYQFFEPGLDVPTQAQVVIDKLGKLGPGDLPAVIDVEATSGLPPAEVAAAVGEWLDLVEAGTGKKPIIYTGKYFWQDNVGSAAYADYPLWHAQYPDVCQPPANQPPPACGCANIAEQWSTWLMWQYTSSQIVPGITENTVDTSVFFGNQADLVAFANQGGYAAKVVSVDAPATVLAGETFDVVVTLENSGGKAWDAATKIGTTEPRDRASDFHDTSWIEENRVMSLAGVEPGGELTVTMKLHAPTALGPYTEHFGLVEEAVTWFADQGGPADDAIALQIQVVDAPLNGSGGAGGSAHGGHGGGGAAGSDGDDSSDGCSCSSAPTRAPHAAWLAVAVVGLLRQRRRRY